MANPNPYKDVDVPRWVKEAFERGDWEPVKKHMQFCIHSKRKFEKCYHREYNRRKKLEDQLDVKQSSSCRTIDERSGIKIHP